MKRSAEAKKCDNSSTLSEKTEDKKTSTEIDEKIKNKIMFQDTYIIKVSEQGRQESDEGDLDKEMDSVMIVTTPRSKGVRSRKRKREVGEKC